MPNQDEISPGEVSTILDPEYHPLEQGDTKDDDGQAIDDYFEPAYNGPVESESYALGVEETVKTTRLLTRTVPTGDAGPTLYEPIQLYPADKNRLHVRIYSDVAIKIAADKTDLVMAATLPANTHWTNDYHNGAIWVVALAAGAGTVHAWVTTC